jgi:5'-3' exonuclease
MILNRTTPGPIKAPSVVIIDGANLNIMVNAKTVNVANIINYIIFLYKKYRPDKMAIVFEGANSLKRRRKVYPEYKKSTGKMYNVKNLEILGNLPIYVLNFPNLESDDVISILVNNHFEGHKKIIVSSDKDYYQLLGGDIVVYDPIMKKEFTKEEFKSIYRFDSSNFLYYKAIIGDKSDNISGVRGLGKEKFYKIFNEFIDQEDWDSNIVYDKISDYVSKEEFGELLYIIEQPNIDMYSLRELTSIEGELEREIEFNYYPILKECGCSIKKDELLKLISLGKK